VKNLTVLILIVIHNLKINNQEIKLKPVSNKDYRFLFLLLKERDPRTDISHKKMPTYTEHIRFIKSKPYSKWYIVELMKDKAGSIYLTKQNEIGIFISKKYQNNKLGKHALTLLMEKNPKKRYLANVNPKNKRSIRFFKNNGFKLIQYTYELK